jgi:hypothetical protein
LVRQLIRFLVRTQFSINTVLETFHFLSQETAFTAGISLLLAHIVLPSVVNTSFIECAKRLLYSRGINGDSAATYFSAELSALDAFALTIRDLTPDVTEPSGDETCFGMIHDGKELGDAILHIIQLDPDHPRAQSSSSYPTEVQRAPGTQRAATPASNDQWAGSFLFPGDSTVENTMTFDMEDLRWLDSVQ